MDGRPGVAAGAGGGGAGTGVAAEELEAATGVTGSRLAEMALFPSSSRPRTLMEQLLARKIEAAAAASAAAAAASSASSSPLATGSVSGPGTPTSPTSPTAGGANPLPLGGVGLGGSLGLGMGVGLGVGLGLGMGMGMGVVSRLRRTDSLDSTSSLGSLAFGEDVCRCDDCLLGIVDLYVISAAEAAKKKVRHARIFGVHWDVWKNNLTLVKWKIIKDKISNNKKLVFNVISS